ncbi:MAG: hypothetical protein WCJ39_07860 [bacterium]
MDDISKAYISYVEGNKSEYDANFKKIENRIHQLYIAFDLSYPGNIAQAISNLETKLQKEYEIPPSTSNYIKNLPIITNWINTITNAGFASAKDDGQNSRQNQVKKTSSKLKFQ